MENKEKEQKTVTRAEKREKAKKLIKDALKKSAQKPSELIDGVSKSYQKLFPEESENINDIKGRIGSLIDVMKKDEEIILEDGVYTVKKAKKRTAKKVETATETAEEKPDKKTVKRTKKAVKSEEKQAEKEEKKQAEKEEKKQEEETLPLPTAPVLPIAPVAPITPEVAPEPIPEDKPKKRTVRKAKKTEEKPVENAEVKTEEVKQEVKEVLPTKEEKVEKVEKESSPKGTLMDMSFLIGEPKKVEVKAEVKTETKTEKPVPVPPKTEQKPKTEQRKPVLKKTVKTVSVSRVKKPMTADEKLQEAFLNRLHRLGGEYFEYFSVYLLEKYSRQNGRRLEGLKITAGERDGGIDGEIELTDRLGFRETIYIQAKNWNPDKGDERLWVVGETLLQQFIGACVCRQAKDGKQHCRGIFITTSRFTPEARKILDDTSDKFVGYDGTDLYEAAKECAFGLVKKNGEWTLDEELLSGEKAFFRMY